MAFASPAPLLLVIASLVAAPLAAYRLWDEPDAATPMPEGPGPGLVDTPSIAMNLYYGTLHVPDPTGDVFGPQAALWHESCLPFPLYENAHTLAALVLDRSATDGMFEDLDLYFRDADARLIASFDGPTYGVGLHHEAPVPAEAFDFLVCLKGGTEAEFSVQVT